MLPTDSATRPSGGETLVLSAVFITALSVVWVATYWALGLYLSAAIAFAYQVVRSSTSSCSPGPGGTGSSDPASWR